MTFLLKDPAAMLDYAIDWGADYLEEDSLAQSDWSVVPAEPGGVAVSGSVFDAKFTTATVSGGLAGRVYQLINHVMTQQGRQDSRSVVLRVEQR